jgi:hypothetical protein
VFTDVKPDILLLDPHHVGRSVRGSKPGGQRFGKTKEAFSRLFIAAPFGASGTSKPLPTDSAHWCGRSCIRGCGTKSVGLTSPNNRNKSAQ